MNNSIFIARAMGVFLLVLSLSLLINARTFIPAVVTIFHDGALQFILGMILLVIGTLLNSMHNVREKSWVVVITIISWIAFIKGILYLMFPACVQGMAQQFIQTTSWIYVGGIINILIGLYFCLYRLFCFC